MSCPIKALLSLSWFYMRFSLWLRAAMISLALQLQRKFLVYTPPSSRLVTVSRRETTAHHRERGYQIACPQELRRFGLVRERANHNAHSGLSTRHRRIPFGSGQSKFNLQHPPKPNGVYGHGVENCLRNPYHNSFLPHPVASVCIHASPRLYRGARRAEGDS